MYKKALIMVMLMLIIPAILFAQGITTASINGTVTAKSGEPLVGANVIATHEPTGTLLGAASRSDGRFNIPGVKVGGPYTVTASYIGYRTSKQENIMLAIGQDFRVNFTMVEEAVELSEIVTVAEKDAILTASNTGTVNNVTTAQIERLPTITRSVSDFTRLTPQAQSAAGGTSIAGKNNRYNNFQVDGAILDDAFGLPSDGFPTGQVEAQPISLDAIQEFQVQVAPYDVRSGSFAGGLINAVTRSGTNQFSGSGYYFGRNESFVGDLNEQAFSDFKDFQSGFRFGGPIVQNKAFFFLSGEIRRRDQPTSGGLSDSNAPTKFPITSAQMQEIIDITTNQYGYNPGGFNPFTNETNDDKIFARLDINLSKEHRLTLRHNYVKGSFGDGVIRNTTNYTLESNQFDRDNTTNSTVMQLNSVFGAKFANEARIAYTTVRDKRTPLAAVFPSVQIDVAVGDVFLGTERSSQANALDQDILEITDNVLYFTGDHTITVGSHNEFISFNNLFVQQIYGAYEFDSIADYQAGNPSRFRSSISKVAGNDRPRADWSYTQLGFYVQDEWKASPKLNLTLGVRADIPVMSEKPLHNTVFEAAFPGRRTDEVPSGNFLLSPRFGFNYDMSDNRTTQIRGGVGMFAGLPPGVWLSNQYSNTGEEFTRIDVRGDAAPDFVADPFNQPLPPGVDPNARQTTEVDVTDTDFKLPQVLRTNLAVDHQLPQGLVGTLEFIYSKDINEVRFRNLNIGDAGEPIGTIAIDGRPDYGRVKESSSFTNVVLLDNTSKGYSWNVAARIAKQLNQGPLPSMFGSLSYVLSDAKDINSGRSSTALSNWQFNETDDPNGETVGRSDFLVRHRILADLSYQLNYGRGLATTLSLFYEGRSGAPFNYMYRGDANGDTFIDNDLVFVPSSADQIAKPENFAAIDAFIQSEDALQDARGKIFERNTATAPWQNRLDLRIAQSVPSIRSQNFEITFDVLNFLNLLNSEWGENRFVNLDVVQFLNMAGYVDGKPDVSLRVTDTNRDGTINRDDVFVTSDLASRWQIQLGVRYSF